MTTRQLAVAHRKTALEVATGERRRPGQVRDAIFAFLGQQTAEGASLADIRAAVEQTLGKPVPPSSVRSYLNENTPALFVRLGRGHYALAKS
jgi:hypothetical protein